MDAPRDSYAFNRDHNVGIFFVEMEPGSSYKLEPTLEGTNRSIYYVTGNGLQANGEKLLFPSQSNVDATTPIQFQNTGTEKVEFLILQGKPINEKVVQHGPFVMNSQNEIYAAFDDYQRTRFGGWPWDQQAVVFPREKGRFLKLKDGVEQIPK